MKGLINGTFRGVANKYLDNYVNYVKTLRQGTNLFDVIISNPVRIARNSLKSKVAF
jgi:hypothetical protein